MWVTNITVSNAVLAQVRASNSKLFLAGRNVLVVGGTGGIGAAAAIKFAQLGANVTIAGRNKQNGAEVVEKMIAISPNKETAKFKFLSVDITIMKDVRRFTSEYIEYNNEGLNTLLVTSGGLNYGSKRDTEEGVEHNFALSYLGRFLTINKLIPQLLKAKEGGGRAMSVLSAGVGTEIDLEDIQMKRDGAYTKLKAVGVNSMANDLMVEELSEQNKGKDVAFFHLNPGFVVTDILHNSKIPLATFWKSIMKWFGNTPEEYAEIVVHIATSPDFGPENSGIGVDQNAKKTKRNAFQDTPGARERLFQYSAEISGLNLD